MPAPAVIPAPKAYINAVAVKGFVVELWAVSCRLVRGFSNPARLRRSRSRRTLETQTTGAVPSPLTRVIHAGVRPFFLL